MNPIEQEKQDSTIYAPVLIPTLCRFDHFKQCIESLSHCIWADKTEVFIGLDYPSKESHWDGYNKIKNYLETATLGFKKLHVIVREKNYGTTGQNSNALTLRRQVFKQFDRVILTEDDNIFSPNFLIYLNRGLEKFQDDRSVFAVIGYRHFYPIKMSDNTFFRQNVEFCAWGYGIWRNRYESLPPCDYFIKNFSFKKLFSIKRDLGGNLALKYWSYYFRPFSAWYDIPMGVYTYLMGMDLIMPTKASLVRNLGWDGTGENCTGPDSLVQQHMTQNMADDTDFDFVGSGHEFYKENQTSYRTNSYSRVSNFFFWKKFIKWLIKFMLIKLSGREPRLPS